MLSHVGLPLSPKDEGNVTVMAICDTLKYIWYIIRKYVLPIWSEHNYIFLHSIVHWVHNYMFQPCILAIIRLYCKLNKQLYNMCVGYSGGNEISSYISGYLAYEH